MKCEECLSYNNFTTHIDCKKCKKYQNFIRNNEVSKEITLDYDSLYEGYFNLIQILYYTEKYGYKVMFRYSSSGNGIHVKIISDNTFTFEERICIRRILNEDRMRIELDLEDYNGYRDTDLLYMMKGLKWVGEWIEATIETINLVLNPIPFYCNRRTYIKCKRYNKYAR